VAVFVNVVLRYGFGSGIAASEELSRLLFVWMVFIGATAAYPAGEHMAFTSLVGMAAGGRWLFAALTAVIRVLVLLACACWPGAPGSRWWWAGQPFGGAGLPDRTAAAAGAAVRVAIGVMVLIELVRGQPLTWATARKWSDREC
jgi:TRAP-type C4-dicarboxylate transport system permease small subunit